MSQPSPFPSTEPLLAEADPASPGDASPGDASPDDASPDDASAEPLPRWRRTLRRVWAPPDPDLVDAGVRGEWTLAGLRVLIVVLLLSVPLDRYLELPGGEGRRDVLWVAVAALAEALVLYSAVRRSWGRRWIGFFSGLVDVSLVTLTLWLFLRLDQPAAATRDLVVFPLYLLAIGATALRYDWRICVLAGGAAVAGYASVVAYADWLWGLGEESAEQLGRLFLLVLATVLATTVVVRARELRRLSNRDRLTGLANRGFLDESLDRLAAIASRSGQAVTLAMLDVDHFKRFNDTWGHPAGDECLRRVAGALQDTVRSTDLVARYGGEEFAVVFPGMGLDDARWRLDGLRREVAALDVDVGRGERVRVTVSIGVAVWPHDGLSLGAALAAADRRLYEAKRRGRDRVVAEG